MATFQLKDGFGLNETLTVAQGALSKYFESVPDLSVSKIDLSQIAGQDLTNPTVTDSTGGVTFSHPIDVGHPTVEITIGASSSGELSIFVPAKDQTPLFDPDTFGDEIPVALSQRYVSLTLSGALTAGATVSPSDLKFGFDAKSNVSLAYYERFVAGTTVLQAVKGTVERFCIPGDLDDIAAMPEGSIATVESSGDLKFSGSVNLLALTNPLASVDLPGGNSASLSGGLAVTVGADYEFTGEYQIRVQRLAGKTFRLGVYRKKDSQFDLSVDANASLTAKLGDSDLFVKLMQAISSDPKGDLSQLESAGLTADQSAAIQIAIKNAVNRSLEIGLSLELSSDSESDAMFLYEINLDAVQTDGRAILHAALDGDFSALVKTDVHPPLGMQRLKSLVSTSKTRQYSLKLNLLGIYNVQYVSKLLMEGTTAWDAQTGELVLTDKVSSDKIQVVTSDFRVKDSDKLRAIVSQSFYITAAYRAAVGVLSAPTLLGVQYYFHLEQNPNKARISDYLMLSSAMGLQSDAAARAELPNIDDFGMTTIYAESSYDATACRNIFYKGGVLLTPDDYIDAGLNAIKSLVQPGDSDAYRLVLADSKPLFEHLQTIGNVQNLDFINACINAGVPKENVSTVAGDYINIAWFATAMTGAGQRLQKIDQYLQANPHADPNNHDFLNLKRDLAKHLKGAVERTNVDFEGPWGFTTMAWLRKASSQKWLLLNKYVTKLLP